MKKKIIFVLNGFGWGGLSKINTIVADKLEEKYDVIIYSSGKGENPFETGKNIYYEHYKYSYLSYLLPKYIKGFSRKTGLPINPLLADKEKISKLISYIEKEDISTLILNAGQIVYAPVIKRCCPQVKIIGWLHNSVNTYLNNYFKSIKQYFLSGIKSVDVVVCLTNNDQKSFVPLNNNSICIYNPLSIHNTEKSSLDLRKISFVGRLSKMHKGLDYLVEVAKYIPDDWTIEVAGNGNKKEIRDFLNCIRTNDVSDKVRYVGTLQGQELINHYLNSSIYLMTSRWEGMPLVLAEAMSFGLPIVAFDQSGSNEVLVDGKFGILVENGDVKELARKLRYLCHSKKERKRFSKLSLERVKDFNLESVCQKWDTII